MSVSVLVAGLLMVWGPTHVTCLPDLSWDYTQHDILLTLNETAVTYIKKTRYYTEDMPLECRQDICKAEETFDPWHGYFAWPRTPIAYRVYLRCPYAFDEPKYAYRDCLFDEVFNATWSYNVVADDCPGPPLWEAVQTLRRDIPSASDRMDDTVRKFEYLYDVIQRCPDMPFSPDAIEVIDVFNLTSALMNHIASGSLTLDRLQEVINVVEFLLTGSLQYILDVYMPAISGMLHQLTQLEHLLQQEADGNQFTMASINETVVINIMKMRAGQIETFLDDDSNHIVIEIPPGDFPDAWVTMMYFGASLPAVLLQGVTFSGPLENDLIHDIGSGDYPPPLPHSLSYINHTLSRRRRSTDTGYTPPDDITTTYAPDDDVTFPAFSFPPESIFYQRYAFDMYRGFTFINSSARPPSNSAHRPIINHTHTHDKSLIFQSQCARSPEDSYDTKEPLLEKWYYYTDNKHCETIEVSENITICRCQSDGFLGLFVDKQINASVSKQLEEIVPLGLLLGFPYIRELYFASHVFRAVSLVCLVLTILTFALFGKTRRGRPTHILIQLCLSLIALLIVLYITQIIGATKLGCVAANVLRYYFVLVSLLWNGVEAYNMYLMLVKVFDHNTHRLVTKAAIVAWGLPALMVTVILAVDQRAFHGYYVECNFQCRLPDNTLYYGYLLPMSVIILHNLAVFVLVIKVLLKSSRAPVRAGQSMQTTPSVSWQQVYGAVAMLVLLGVPWMFSAFGAVSNDANDSLKTLEAVFQIVFIVCINLQGMFIFIFHCARNADIRKQWRSTLGTTKGSDVSANSSKTHSTSI